MATRVPIGSKLPAGTSVTQLATDVPTYVYGFSSASVFLVIFGSLLSFLIFFGITIAILRAWNPYFLRDVCTNGQCESISVWRSIWISAIIALIPTFLVAAVLFVVGSNVSKTVAVVAGKAIDTGII